MGWEYDKETGQKVYKHKENLGWFYIISAIVIIGYIISIIDGIREDRLKDQIEQLEEQCSDYECEIDDYKDQIKSLSNKVNELKETSDNSQKLNHFAYSDDEDYEYLEDFRDTDAYCKMSFGIDNALSELPIYDDDDFLYLYIFFNENEDDSISFEDAKEAYENIEYKVEKTRDILNEIDDY